MFFHFICLFNRKSGFGKKTQVQKFQNNFFFDKKFSIKNMFGK